MLKVKWQKPEVMTDLTTRMKTSMPVVLDGSSEGIIRVIHPDFKSSNFIIYEATIENGMSGNNVEDLNYQTTMLKKNGEPAELMRNQWIDGTQLSMLVAHPHKTIKYVFDKTIKSSINN